MQLCLIVGLFISIAVAKREFYVDWENDRFVRDGKTFQYASAGMHYFRIPYQYWENRIYAAKTAGMNAIQTYVAWNMHEPVPRQYNFEENLNIVGFIKEVQQQNMELILRVGPYICAEWDFGGLPPWLLGIPGMQVRTSNADYLKATQAWLNVILPLVKPYLYKNGGPIIMVQVENEYGSYGCDHDYMDTMYKMFHNILEDDVVIFTTDGPGGIKCGSYNTTRVLTTIDFGTGGDPAAKFDNLKKFQPHGPLVNSEFYTGWLDHWGHAHSKRSAGPLGDVFGKLLDMKASVNLYMWHGGTNFGLGSGAEKATLNTNPTSYDYDAPQSEWGDLKLDKYWALRNVTSRIFPGNHLPVPENGPKLRGKTVKLVQKGLLADQISEKTFLKRSTFPTKMEQLRVFEGIVAYQTKLAKPLIGAQLAVLGVHDRAYVLADGKFVKVVKRSNDAGFEVSASDTLTILVENMGYIGFGGFMKDYLEAYKGIVNVTVDGVELTNWDHYKIDVWNPEGYHGYHGHHGNTTVAPSEHSYNNKQLQSSGPTVYSGTIELTKAETLDTFLDTSCWSKGYLLVNNRLMGRYWPDAGPQYTLYIPGVYLVEGTNTVTIVELQSACDTLSVTLTDKPNIDGPFNPNA